MNGKNIFPVETDKIGNIDFKRDITAVVVFQKTAVQVEIGNSGDSFKIDGDSASPGLPATLQNAFDTMHHRSGRTRELRVPSDRESVR